MKKLSLIVSFLVIFLGVNHANGMAATIEGMRLSGGNGDTEATWTAIGGQWSTLTSKGWVIGVSTTPNGVLINNADKTIGGLQSGIYWLYIEPYNIGNNPKLEVFLSDGSLIRTVFNAVTWLRVFGDTRISLKLVPGTVDKVGETLTPNGISDWYLQADIVFSVITLTPDFKMHLQDIQYNTISGVMSIWADLAYDDTKTDGVYFKVTGAGYN